MKNQQQQLLLIDNLQANLSASLYVSDLKIEVNNLTKQIEIMNEQLKTSQKAQIEILARVDKNERQIKEVTARITDGLASIESKATADISSLSSSVTNLSSDVTKIQSNLTSLFTNEEQSNQSIFNRTFGNSDIGLWDMGGKFLHGKVNLCL